MKYLKLYENFNEESIHEICIKYNIQNYIINEDETIDVHGSVDFYNKKLTKLPLKFRNITGNFHCSFNELTTLEGCPKSVGGSFYCNYNNLTSLEYFPEIVNVSFDCSHNKLTSLKFISKKIINFFCNNNDIRDFRYFDEPVGNFYCENNPIYNIWKLFMDKTSIELLNDYDCIRGEDIVIDRFNQFLEEIDKPTVKSVHGYNNI